MVQCLFCGKELPEAKNRNKVEKKFCGNRCRWDYHNRGKIEAFHEELMILMKKYGYLR